MSRDIPPPTKTDEASRGVKFDHPSYGVVKASRISGQTDLFMVDYPQRHYIGISVETATHRRDLSNDWVFGEREIVHFYMSEVQWARFVASIGDGGGVPCTLYNYRDPGTGKTILTAMHQSHQSRSALFAEEVEETARDATGALDKALAKAREMVDGGPAKKSDLKVLVDAIETAQRELGANLPFVIKQAGEAIETAVESAKGEIDAYQQFAVAKLGRLALAEREEQQRLERP